MRNLKSETHTAQPLISLCPLRPSRALHWANRRVSELPLSLCPFRSLSLSLSRHGQVQASLLSFCFVIFFFFFLSFFLLSADCFGPFVWCTVACYIYNTKSFFFFFNPTHCVILYCVYIYIYLFICSLLSLAL